MALSAFTLVSNMTLPFPANRGSNNVSTPFNPFKTRFCDYLVDGKETVSLLEAPPITRKTQWKLRSCMNYVVKLRPKIKTHSADSLISVIGNHFHVNTHVATTQAKQREENHSTVWAETLILDIHIWL